MFERFLGRKQKGVETKTVVPASKIENFNIQDGHAYVLLGGVAEDIKTSCSECGAGYKGPCQGSCEYCLTQRKVFYADITNADFQSISSSDEIKDMAFIIPDGDSAEFGYNTNIDMVIAEEVTVDEEFNAKLVVTKKFTGGYNAQIKTLILIDEGSASFDEESWVGTLITGKKTSIKFGYNCRVDTLLKTSSLKYKADEEFSIGKTQIISPENFIQAISKALQ